MIGFQQNIVLAKIRDEFLVLNVSAEQITCLYSLSKERKPAFLN
ncbi:flagellar biosynthetic protein FliO [Mediterraneibacter glycyrrhizinilyticus]|nr:flagellar biosynthetic protein FliO [Mediterraneibacter glycyrrhizinilyticus]